MGAARCSMFGAIVAAAFAPFFAASTERVEDRPEHWADAKAAFAARSDGGFLVWESNRSGRWRIWRQDLDGSGTRQLTPDEPGRDHYCAHLSPDGKRVVFATLPVGTTFYQERAESQAGELHVIDTDGTNRRRIAPRCRSYFEDRAALWIDDDRLFYIDGDGVTQRLDLTTGDSEAVFDWNQAFWGWLPNVAETHATAGWPMFPPFDAASGRILYRQRLKGCQPYFSRDNRWGFFTGGGGGPLHRFDLKNRRFSPIVDTHDERLPESRRYLYFPMLSACQNAFAFGASYYEHHHFRSDYDIFIAPIDPFTLELEADPIRYTFDAACDRFPDVHFCELRLGKQRGVAPFRADFSDRVDGDGWRFEFGDGSGTESGSSHIYTDPGLYWVLATRGDSVCRGRVRVDAPRGPIATRAVLTAGDTITVEFDGELILGERPHAQLDADAVVTAIEIGPARDRLTLSLDRPLRKRAELELEDVFGLLAPRLPATTDDVVVELEAWPIQPDALGFAFEHGDTENLAIEFATGTPIDFGLTALNGARFDRRYALSPNGGSFVSLGGARNTAIAASTTGVLAIELAIEPASLEQRGTLFAIRTEDGDAELVRIEQNLEECVATFANGVGKPIEIRVPIELRATHLHFLLSADVWQAASAHVDARYAFHDTTVEAKIPAIPADVLVIGEDWHGTIHHVATHSRLRTDFEIVRSHEQVLDWISSHAHVERRTVRARLLAKSPTPTTIEYPDALGVYEWQVDGETLRVVHWVMRDRQSMPVTDLAIGAEVELDLEPFDAHPECEGAVVSDTLDEAFELDLWFDARL